MKFRVAKQQMEKAAVKIKTRGLAKAERVTREAARRYERVAGGAEWNEDHDCVFCERYAGPDGCMVCPVHGLCNTRILRYTYTALGVPHMAGVVARALVRYADIIRAEARKREVS